MISFYTQVIVWQWYVGQAAKTNDLYLLTRSASQLALFGGRLILAHNKMLYPYHKWFTRQIANAPQKPDGFLTLLENLLKQPSVNNRRPVCQLCIEISETGPNPKTATTASVQNSLKTANGTGTGRPFLWKTGDTRMTG